SGSATASMASLRASSSLRFSTWSAMIVSRTSRASAALLGRATISRQHWRWLKEGSVRNRSSRKFSHSSGKLGNQHVPGHEDDIEHRVVNRLGNLFTLQPDEAEQGRRVPPRSTVQQDAEFGPPRQQPAAALGAGFELGDQQPRVVGPERLPGELDLFRRRDVEQPAAKLLNLLEQPRVNFLD